MAMDGIWTFVIPERQGGGVIAARGGKLYGGDIGYFLEGKYTESGNSVQGEIEATIFNRQGIQQSVWGDTSDRFRVTFSGTVNGNMITGKIQRTGMPAQFALTLSRRADLP